MICVSGGLIAVLFMKVVCLWEVSKGLEYLEISGFYCMMPCVLLQIMTVLP